MIFLISARLDGRTPDPGEEHSPDPGYEPSNSSLPLLLFYLVFLLCCAAVSWVGLQFLIPNIYVKNKTRGLVDLLRTSGKRLDAMVTSFGCVSCGSGEYEKFEYHLGINFVRRVDCGSLVRVYKTVDVARGLYQKAERGELPTLGVLVLSDYPLSALPEDSESAWVLNELTLSAPLPCALLGGLQHLSMSVVFAYLSLLPFAWPDVADLHVAAAVHIASIWSVCFVSVKRGADSNFESIECRVLHRGSVENLELRVEWRDDGAERFHPGDTESRAGGSDTEGGGGGDGSGLGGIRTGKRAAAGYGSFIPRLVKGGDGRILFL